MSLYLGSTQVAGTFQDAYTTGQTDTLLNAKMDTSASNATATGKETIVGWGMPSDTYITTTFVSSAVGTYTYTAPANGWFYFTFVCGTGNGSSVIMQRNGIQVDKLSSVGHNGGLQCACKKDDVISVTIATSALYALSGQRFFYCEGEV